jgi:lysophospholipase L1-like esterase
MERHERIISEVKTSNPQLLFVGDSITQYWENDGPEKNWQFRRVWDKYYGARKALNLGFSGDTTANVLWRLEHGELDGIDPKVTVLLIGVNNRLVHWTAEQTDGGIDAVIDDLHKLLPGTRILLLGILPSGISPQVSETNTAVNRYLEKKYGGSKFVTFVDVSKLFMKDGKLDESLYLETYSVPPQPPLHPTSLAMEKLADAIEPVLDKLYMSRH